MLKTVTLIARGVIADARMRRWAMFILLLAAMLMVFAGSTFLADDISAPLRFFFYWGVCAWLTFASLLLAVFDLLMVRAAARRERRRLAREIMERKPPTSDDNDERP